MSGNSELTDVLRELSEIKDNPSILDEQDSEMEKVLKEVIKIQRRHLYGLDKTSVRQRKDEIQKLLIKELQKMEY
jgi:hypothetical protein